MILKPGDEPVLRTGLDRCAPVASIVETPQRDAARRQQVTSRPTTNTAPRPLPHPADAAGLPGAGCGLAAGGHPDLPQDGRAGHPAHGRRPGRRTATQRLAVSSSRTVPQARQRGWVGSSWTRLGLGLARVVWASEA